MQLRSENYFYFCRITKTSLENSESKQKNLAWEEFKIAFFLPIKYPIITENKVEK